MCIIFTELNFGLARALNCAIDLDQRSALEYFTELD